MKTAPTPINDRPLAKLLEREQTKLISALTDAIQEEKSETLEGIVIPREAMARNFMRSLLDELECKPSGHQADHDVQQDPVLEARGLVRHQFMFQKTVVKYLRGLPDIPQSRWPEVYFRLIKVFQEMLRPRAQNSCEACRSALNEDLARTKNILRHLKEVPK
jgi:hypothetical protein